MGRPLKDDIIRAHILKALKTCTGSDGYNPSNSGPSKTAVFVTTVCTNDLEPHPDLYQEVGTFPIATWYPAGNHPNDADLDRLWDEIFRRLCINRPADRSSLTGTSSVSYLHNQCVKPHTKGKGVCGCNG